MQKIHDDAAAGDKMLSDLNAGASQNVFKVDQSKFTGNLAQKEQQANQEIRNNLANLGIAGQPAENLMKWQKSGALGFEGGGRKLAFTKPIDLKLPFDTEISSYGIKPMDDTHVSFQLFILSSSCKSKTFLAKRSNLSTSYGI